MAATLTKSNYMLGRQCEKALWLRFNAADLADHVGPALQRRFEEGQEIGRLAHRLFPGGITVKSPASDWSAAFKETNPLIKRADAAIFEGAVLYDGVGIRADILLPTAAGWDLIEVKASTSTKPEHIDDLAIQWHVLSGNGLSLNRAYLLRLNKDYIRHGELDLAAFFVKEEVTAEVRLAAEEIPKRISRFRQIIESEKRPVVDVGGHCDKPHPCRFSGYCWATVPPLSVHFIPRISSKKLALLKDMRILEQHQIPEDFDLSDTQKKWINAAKSGVPELNREALVARLSSLQYPLAFLDFESVNLAIPPFDGVRPFMQLAFQASVRIVEKDGTQRHEEFLGDGRTDPRPALARFLADVIPLSGSVVAYFATFERGRLNELAQLFPEFQNQLQNAASRLWDLLDLFSKGHYVDHRFQGSSSIKYVLPVLVPEMSYSALAIRDGVEAAAAYERLMFEDLELEEREATKRSLKEYCGQDTLAMVQILQVLRSAVA